MSGFLSRKEVEDLTSAKTKKRQIRNLCQNGIRHTINAAGWPTVTWRWLEGVQEKDDATKKWKPSKAS